jgi:AmiR/NasT family two-component response regulator
MTTLLARTAFTFNDESEHIGLLLAAHAAVACSAAQRQAGLARKVVTRQLIGQAQGILVGRHEVTPEQAFAMLVRVSQHRNDELRSVAERLVLSGQLDPV